MEQNFLVSFDEFDTNRVVADRTEVERHIPQRFEMSLLDGLYFEDREKYRAVGFKKLPMMRFGRVATCQGLP